MEILYQTSYKKSKIAYLFYVLESGSSMSSQNFRSAGITTSENYTYLPNAEFNSRHFVQKLLIYLPVYASKNVLFSST